MAPRSLCSLAVVAGAALAAALLAGSAALLAGGAAPAWADDTELLRRSSAKPYLFVLLDNSASMALRIGPGQNPPPGGGYGDDPESRLYQAKSALYTVFRAAGESSEIGIHFGLASFNQDGLRAVGKHWLYHLAADPPWFDTLPYPQGDPDGITQPELLDGVPTGAWVGDVEGDSLSFGPRLDGAGADEMGSCAAPLELGALASLARLRINAFPRPQDATTVLWLAHGGRTYRMAMRPLQPPGGATLPVRFDLEEFAGCSSAGRVAAGVTLTLRSDPGLSEFFMVDLGRPGDRESEDSAGLWQHRDVVSDTSVAGWEGNYDGGDCGSLAGGECASGGVSDLDPHDASCDPRLPAACNLKWDPTLASPFGPALDRGDLLPFDWDDPNAAAFLARLSPDPWPRPHFGAARYFEHSAILGGWAPRWQLVTPATTTQPLLLAEGETPLAAAIRDFRCWYLGAGAPGAGQVAASAAPITAAASRSSAAATTMPGAAGRVFLLLITDGDETAEGTSGAPAADIADLARAGVRTWILNLGDPAACARGGSLYPILEAQRGEGRCIPIGSKTDLLATLDEIKVKMVSASRAFAPAAVPAVRVEASQSIAVLTLRATPPSQADDGSPAPRPGEDSVWDGHLLSFLKDLPTDADGQLDTSRRCTSTDPEGPVRRSCLLWDAGQRMLEQVGTPGSFLGAAPNRRRVFYSRLVDAANGQPLAGALGKGRRLLDPTSDATAPEVRYDLWRGLGIAFHADGAGAAAVDTAAQRLANAVIEKTLSRKHHEFFADPQAATKTVIDNILGDVFHSTPLVVGEPRNTHAYAADTGAELNAPGAECGNRANPDRGYRCFARRHANRRRLLVAGANDGQLHAFDLGIFRATRPVRGAGGRRHRQGGLGLRPAPRAAHHPRAQSGHPAPVGSGWPARRRRRAHRPGARRRAGPRGAGMAHHRGRRPARRRALVLRPGPHAARPLRGARRSRQRAGAAGRHDCQSGLRALVPRGPDDERAATPPAATWSPTPGRCGSSRTRRTTTAGPC